MMNGSVEAMRLASAGAVSDQHALQRSLHSRQRREETDSSNQRPVFFDQPKKVAPSSSDMIALQAKRVLGVYDVPPTDRDVGAVRQPMTPSETKSFDHSLAVFSRATKAQPTSSTARSTSLPSRSHSDKSSSTDRQPCAGGSAPGKVKLEVASEKSSSVSSQARHRHDQREDEKHSRDRERPTHEKDRTSSDKDRHRGDSEKHRNDKERQYKHSTNKQIHKDSAHLPSKSSLGHAKKPVQKEEKSAAKRDKSAASLAAILFQTEEKEIRKPGKVESKEAKKLSPGDPVSKESGKSSLGRAEVNDARKPNAHNDVSPSKKTAKMSEGKGSPEEVKKGNLTSVFLGKTAGSKKPEPAEESAALRAATKQSTPHHVELVSGAGSGIKEEGKKELSRKALILKERPKSDQLVKDPSPPRHSKASATVLSVDWSSKSTRKDASVSARVSSEHQSENSQTKEEDSAAKLEGKHEKPLASDTNSPASLPNQQKMKKSKLAELYSKQEFVRSGPLAMDIKSSQQAKSGKEASASTKHPRLDPKLRIKIDRNHMATLEKSNGFDEIDGKKTEPVESIFKEMSRGVTPLTAIANTPLDHRPMNSLFEFVSKDSFAVLGEKKIAEKEAEALPRNNLTVPLSMKNESLLTSADDDDDDEDDDDDDGCQSPDRSSVSSDSSSESSESDSSDDDEVGFHQVTEVVPAATGSSNRQKTSTSTLIGHVSSDDSDSDSDSEESSSSDESDSEVDEPANYKPAWSAPPPPSTKTSAQPEKKRISPVQPLMVKTVGSLIPISPLNSPMVRKGSWLPGIQETGDESRMSPVIDDPAGNVESEESGAHMFSSLPAALPPAAVNIEKLSLLPAKRRLSNSVGNPESPSKRQSASPESPVLLTASPARQPQQGSSNEQRSPVVAKEMKKSTSNAKDRTSGKEKSSSSSQGNEQGEDDSHESSLASFSFSPKLPQARHSLPNHSTMAMSPRTQGRRSTSPQCSSNKRQLLDVKSPSYSKDPNRPHVREVSTSPIRSPRKRTLSEADRSHAHEEGAKRERRPSEADRLRSEKRSRRGSESEHPSGRSEGREQTHLPSRESRSRHERRSSRHEERYEHSSRTANRERRGHDYYMRKAKQLKHEADSTPHKPRKALKYMEAAMSFIQCGQALEQAHKTSSGEQRPTASAATMYSDTLELLKYISGLQSGQSNNNNGRGPPLASISKELAVILLRCQAVLYMRMLILRQDQLSLQQKNLHEVFTTMKPAAQPESPWSVSSSASNGSPTPSPAEAAGMNTPIQSGAVSTTSSQASSTPAAPTLPFPQHLISSGLGLCQGTRHMLSALRCWQMADDMNARHCERFFRDLDRSTAAISLPCALTQLVDWAQLGIRRLQGPLSA